MKNVMFVIDDLKTLVIPYKVMSQEFKNSVAEVDDDNTEIFIRPSTADDDTLAVTVSRFGINRKKFNSTFVSCIDSPYVTLDEDGASTDLTVDDLAPVFRKFCIDDRNILQVMISPEYDEDSKCDSYTADIVDIELKSVSIHSIEQDHLFLDPSKYAPLIE